MDPAIGGALISAGSSLLGGLFGGREKQKAEWVTPKYGDIRKKAEAAGFNPLTALSMNAGGVGTSVQGPSFGQRLASGLADAFTAYSDQKTLQTELDQRERELQLKEKAAEALSRQTRYTSGLVSKQTADVEAVKPKPYAEALLEGGVDEMGTQHSAWDPTATRIGGVVPTNASTISPTAVRSLHDDMLRADPENPVEIEADAYAAARVGQLPEFAYQLITRNNFTSPVWWHNKIARSGYFDTMSNAYNNHERQMKREAQRDRDLNSLGTFQLQTPSMMMGGNN